MNIAVIGCGLMGAGIAEVLARAGHSVAVHDGDAARPVALARRVAGIRAEPTLEEAALGAELVIEAVAEEEEVKRDVFERLGRVAPLAIVASNTSSLRADALATGVADRSRFVIAHFFNPATVVPLVEIVRVPETSENTVSVVRDLLISAGKHPVVLDRDTPGFVANRLQAALLREAFALERAGIATFEDIDSVVRAGLGSRWAAAGPFAIADLGGLDIWEAVSTQLFPLLSTETGPPPALTDRVRDGRLGAKSGRGLFDHDPDSDDDVRRRIAAHFRLEYPAPTS